MIHIYIYGTVYIYDTVNVHNIYIMYVLGYLRIITIHELRIQINQP